jgi:hypothetical protein
MRVGVAILMLTLLAGCSSVRDVRLVVRDASTNEPAPGVRVRAITLNTGTVPLPLNEDTLDEILSTGSVVENATTSSSGEVTLSLRRRAAHVVELVPPPLGPGAPVQTPRITRFVLERGASGIERSDDAPGPDVFTVEVKR